MMRLFGRKKEVSEEKEKERKEREWIRARQWEARKRLAELQVEVMKRATG
jgi:hypothetical protein